MKAYLYIIILVLVFACTPHNVPTHPITQQVDSIYTIADFRTYEDYYNSGHQVYAIDLLSDGLDYDSAWHISGTGCNLYLSDVFVAKDSTKRLPAGRYEMDSIAKEMTFLRGLSFDGNVTGTYVLVIAEDQIQHILLMTGGNMTIEYEADDVVLDFNLYTEDSTHYHATYKGPAIYR